MFLNENIDSLLLYHVHGSKLKSQFIMEAILGIHSPITVCHSTRVSSTVCQKTWHLTVTMNCEP